jgi:hypothetical protein
MSSTPEYKTPLAPKTLSGALGLAIIPDQATIKRAYALAEEIMPKDAQYVLSEGSLPHLTLYEEPIPALFKKFQALSSSVLVQSALRVPQYIQSPDTHIQPW